MWLFGVIHFKHTCYCCLFLFFVLDWLKITNPNPIEKWHFYDISIRNLSVCIFIVWVSVYLKREYHKRSDVDIQFFLSSSSLLQIVLFGPMPNGSNMDVSWPFNDGDLKVKHLTQEKKSCLSSGQTCCFCLSLLEMLKQIRK